jgi:hypothetical protein
MKTGDDCDDDDAFSNKNTSPLQIPFKVGKSDAENIMIAKIKIVANKIHFYFEKKLLRNKIFKPIIRQIICKIEILLFIINFSNSNPHSILFFSILFHSFPI